MKKINQKIQLTDSRILGFAEYGTEKGKPVFHFHGSGSSRLERPASEEMLKKLGIRFISVDRPGHGLSEFQPNRRLTDWAKDISQLAEHLNVQKFHVTGHSAGGPHALACAHELPEQIIAAAAISSVAPMSRKNAYTGMPLSNKLLAKASRHSPWVTKLIRRIMRNMIVGDVEQATRQLMSSIPESDKEALYNHKNVEILIASIREGFKQGYESVAQDDILINRDWEFSLENINPRIDIWHGETDVNVPIHAGKYLAAEIPNNRTIFLPNKGHFFVLNQWDKILRKLVDES
jgi:pimeloyl-ACP methyl ester carboxylesterase